MAEGEKLENPFATASGPGAKEGDRDGFLSFSSSTPRGSPSGGGPRGFRPKWGKKNRQDNWNRFGQYDQQQQQMNMSAPDGELESATYFGHQFLGRLPFQEWCRRYAAAVAAEAGASAAHRIQTFPPTSAAAPGGPLPTSEAVSGAAGPLPLLLPLSGRTRGSGDTPPTTGAAGPEATGAAEEAVNLTRQ